MMITTSRTKSYGPYGKGVHYGFLFYDDQIAAGPGQIGLPDRPANPTALFRSPQSPRFYTSPDLCFASPASVLQNRLSRYDPHPAGYPEDPRGPGPDQTATLHDPAKSSPEDAKKNVFEGLLATIFEQARDGGLIKKRGCHVCSIDSTGLENHYVSRHFLQRKGRRTDKYRKWTKLTAVCENRSHLIAAALVTVGPSTDCHYLKPAVEQAGQLLSIGTLLADAGYDAEYNHQFCRREFGIRSTVIQVNERGLKYGRISGQHRRRMKQRFPAASYRKRWQIESVFSQIKRRLGNALTARTDESRTSECLLKVLTYNLMIVLCTLKKSVNFQCFLQSNFSINKKEATKAASLILLFYI